jgi:hypothetical protein
LSAERGVEARGEILSVQRCSKYCVNLTVLRKRYGIGIREKAPAPVLRSTSGPVRGHKAWPLTLCGHPLSLTLSFHFLTVRDSKCPAAGLCAPRGSGTEQRKKSSQSASVDVGQGESSRHTPAASTAPAGHTTPPLTPSCQEGAARCYPMTCPRPRPERAAPTRSETRRAHRR